jgi:hypothetical protein
VDVVALAIGEDIAAAADVLSGFETLYEEHDPLLDLVGELDEFGGLVQALQLLDGGAAEVGLGVELVEDPPEQVEVIAHHDDGSLDLFDVAAVRLGVVRQGEVHLLLDADVVDDEALLLVLKLPVHPGDGLDQVVTLDRLVDVDGVEEGYVKTRQPHVHHNRDFEVGFGLLELGVELLAVVLDAEQVVERFLVVLAPRHHHLEALHGEDFLVSV